MQLFVARRAGVPVGRIAAIHNRLHNAVHHDRTGFFGFFECVDDAKIAGRLLQMAAAWLAGHGCTEMVGPVSPSTNDECGLLVEGFDDRPRFLMPYNPPYYPLLMERAGLTVVKRLMAYRLRVSRVLASDKIRRVARIAQERHHLSLRQVNMQQFEEELRTVRRLYNAAWSGNWGFAPITEAEAEFMAQRLKRLVDPSLVIFAEVGGEPVGLALVMRDYNELLQRLDGRLFPFGWMKLITGRKRIEWLRLLLIGVLPEWRTRGIDAALYYQMAQNADRMGIELCEGSWVLEDNEAMNRILPALGGEVYKRFHLYHTATS
jgi:GNAT superfamily N-acetyltransferase